MAATSTYTRPELKIWVLPKLQCKTVSQSCRLNQDISDTESWTYSVTKLNNLQLIIYPQIIQTYQMRTRALNWTLNQLGNTWLILLCYLQVVNHCGQILVLYKLVFLRIFDHCCNLEPYRGIGFYRLYASVRLIRLGPSNVLQSYFTCHISSLKQIVCSQSRWMDNRMTA